MSRLRRLAAIGLGLLAAAAVTLPLHRAAAQDGEPQGTGGWTLDATVERVDDVLRVSGEITPPSITMRVKSVTAVVHRTGGSSSCGDLPAGTDPRDGEDDDEIAAGQQDDYDPDITDSFQIDVPIGCNGTYTATVTAVADNVGYVPGNNYGIDDSSTPGPLDVDGSVTVDEAPPNVPAIVSSIGPDRRITVGWQPPSDYGGEALSCEIAPGGPPDFLGYAVQRSIGDSEFTTVALREPGQQCWIDTLTPTSTQGRYTYRVLTRRAGSGGEITASAASALTASVTVGPPTTAPPATASTVPFRPPSAPARPAGTSGAGTAGTVPPVVTDDTFQETLDYDDEEPGELAADVPDDADTFLDFVPSPGAGILVPFAIAECLAVWALHLRYLARCTLTTASDRRTLE